MEPVAKRQKMNEKKPLLTSLPASQFIDKLSLYEGAKVTITIEGREFKLPKALLCYNSSYFDKAFNGGFREGEEQKINLQGCTTDIFELVIQWLYTSHIVTSFIGEDQIEAEDHCDAPAKPTPKEATIQREQKVTLYSQHITRLLAFLKFTDEIDLIGPFDSITELIKNALKISRKSLTPEHVRSAAELPKNHPIRTLFAQACFPEYVTNGLLEKLDMGKFRFAREVLEIEAFAADLSKELMQAFPKRALRNVNGKGNATYKHFLTDPLMGTPFKVEF